MRYTFSFISNSNFGLRVGVAKHFSKFRPKVAYKVKNFQALNRRKAHFSHFETLKSIERDNKNIFERFASLLFNLSKIFLIVLSKKVAMGISGLRIAKQVA